MNWKQTPIPFPSTKILAFPIFTLSSSSSLVEFKYLSKSGAIIPITKHVSSTPLKNNE